MNAILLSLNLRGRRLSSLALLSAAVLAACETDRPVGPDPAAIPTEASTARLASRGWLSITIVDQNGAAPTTTGAQFTVAMSGQGMTKFLVDNGSGDADSTPNKLQMMLAGGSYTVCQTVAPTDYVLPATACKSVIVGGIVPATLQFVDPTVARVRWRVIDFLQQEVGGAVIKVHDGITWSTIADNSPLDLDPAPGKFEVKSPNGNYSTCGLNPPAGWLFTYSSCFGIPTPHGQTTDFMGFGVQPEYSAYWYVANPDGWGAGPSAYEIKNAAGTWSAIVEDDGLNDRWQAMGSVWVILPGDGDYEVCQTKAPPGTEFPKQPCIQFSIKHGEFKLVGYFVSEWL
ncbi:MAG TPA: hypothetical protein VFZ21_20715 [Gemmatimonadaceae bacterium]|jgi:hypothetical protein|nr:hypothetical protein [Gemmatimonadaceae bacterium]